MTDNAYSLRFSDRMLSDLPLRAFLIHDYPEDDSLEIDALVSSGDAFITLATNLDAMSSQLKDKPEVHPQLEKVIRTLLYLQRHYQIARKHPEHRQ